MNKSYMKGLEKRINTMTVISKSSPELSRNKPIVQGTVNGIKGKIF